MQGEGLRPQGTCPDKAIPAKTVAAEASATKPKVANCETVKQSDKADIAISDVVLADVAAPRVATKASPVTSPPPADSKLPVTLSNAAWKKRQNLPLTIVVPPTPWSDSPVYEHAIALKVAPEWRHRLFGRRDEPRSRYLPCWLTSLVLHMVAIIILGSLASPSTQRFATHGIQLFITSTHEPNVSADLVTFETGPRYDRLPNTSLNPEQTAPKISAEDPFENPAEKQRIKAAEITLASLQSKAEPIADAPANLPAKTNLANQAAAADSAAIVTRRTQDFGGNLAPLDTLHLSNRPTSERQMDDVVERFTQYDIGKLTGEAGEKARRDFEALGPEAIPSLVRGLNKAAQLSASCPVLVINRKLDRSLEANKDPTSLKYALDNLGRGVPKSAKHIGVIKNLKSKWLARTPQPIVADPQTLADILITNGIPATDQVRRRLDQLSNASSDSLARALLGSDKDNAVAAIAILIQRQGEMPEYQKPKLIRGLIRQLKNDGTRLATSKALALLVDYDNYIPREPSVAKPGDKPPLAARPLDEPTARLVETSQHMELFTGPLPPYRRYRPLVVEFLEATDASLPDATASK